MNLALPSALLALLGGAAFLARRRRVKVGRLVELLETTSLGPKRSLILAKLGERTLLLGSSEAGIEMLACLPVSDEIREAADRKAAQVAGAPAQAASASEPQPSQEKTRLARLFHRRQEPIVSFDTYLAESSEDQELRRKLSLGLEQEVQ